MITYPHDEGGAPSAESSRDRFDGERRDAEGALVGDLADIAPLMENRSVWNCPLNWGAPQEGCCRTLASVAVHTIGTECAWQIIDLRTTLRSIGLPWRVAGSARPPLLTRNALAILEGRWVGARGMRHPTLPTRRPATFLILSSRTDGFHEQGELGWRRYSGCWWRWALPGQFGETSAGSVQCCMPSCRHIDAPGAHPSTTARRSGRHHHYPHAWRAMPARLSWPTRKLRPP